MSAASASGGTLTVWLMTGDSTTAVTNAVAAQFEKDYPGWTVNVEVQQWSGITAKVLTSLASSSPPDVMELGNTDVAEYAASGGLTNLTADKSQFQNSSNWLRAWKGLPSSTAGCTPSPSSVATASSSTTRHVQGSRDHQAPDGPHQQLGDGAALKAHYSKVKDFSAFYLPGEEWYAEMPFVWAEGGQIAVEKGGKWQGDLQAKQSIAGLEEYQAFQNFMSTPASRTSTRTPRPTPRSWPPARLPCSSMAPGRSGTEVADNKAFPASDDGTFILPGVTPASQAPVFMGGSDLAIAKNSPNQAQALALGQDLHRHQNQLLQGQDEGFIPNATNLVPRSRSRQRRQLLQGGGREPRRRPCRAGQRSRPTTSCRTCSRRSPRASRMSRPSPRNTTRSSTAC